MDKALATLPEGFVIEPELPEGFIWEEPKPFEIPDPAEEERQINQILNISEKTGKSPSRLIRQQTMINRLFANEEYEEAVEQRKEEKQNEGIAGYWSELLDATARGTARVGASFLRAGAAITRLKQAPGAWALPETPEMRTAKEVRAKEYEQQAELLWEVAKHPELVAQDEGKINKAINLVGETLPYITATTAAYTVAGPLGGFAVGSLVEGNSAYQEAIESGVDKEKAIAIGTGVGVISGAVEAFGGRFAENLFMRAAGKLKNKVAKAGAVFGIGTVVEALEEGAQEITQIAGEEIYRDVDWDEASKRILGSMAGGAFLGGTMRGLSIATKRLAEIPDKPIAEKGLMPVELPMEHAKLEEDLTKAIQEKTGLPEEEARTVAKNAINDKFYMPEKGELEEMQKPARAAEMPIEAEVEGITEGDKVRYNNMEWIAENIFEEAGRKWINLFSPEEGIHTPRLLKEVQLISKAAAEMPIPVSVTPVEARKEVEAGIVEEIKGGGRAFEQTFKISEGKSFVSFTHNRRTGETVIRHAHVPENLRRQGIGTRLLQQAISEIELRYPGVLIKTYPTTPEGKKLILKAGFVKGIERGEWIKEAGKVAPEAAEFDKYFEKSMHKWTSKKAVAIADKLREIGWKVYKPEGGISTESIYFKVESPDGRIASYRISGHGVDKYAKPPGLGSSKSSVNMNVGPGTSVDAAVNAAIKRARFIEKMPIEEKLAIRRRGKVINDYLVGKPVLREVLEEYKGELWADEALAKLAPEAAEGEKQPWDMSREEYGRYMYHQTWGEMTSKEMDFAYQREIENALSEGKLSADEALTKLAPEAAEGEKEGAEPSGGVSFDTAIRTGLKNAEAIQKPVRREQRKTLRERTGAMVGTKEGLLKKGVPPQEAIWRSSGQLRGPQAEYTKRYPALDDIVEPWVIEAALKDIATNPNLGPFDPINLTNPEGTGAFDKFRKGTYLTKGDVALLKKWNNLIGGEAEKRIPWTVRFFSHVEQIMGLFKMPAGYDVQMRRQAGWIRGRHPELYTEAIAKNVVAYMSEERDDKMAAETEDDPLHDDAVEHGVRFLARPGEEGIEPEQYLSHKTIAKIAGIGKVYEASMRGFIDSFNWLQQQLYNQKINYWTQKGTNITDAMKADLADFNNTILGMVKAKSTFGAMARRVLSPVMWSPTLTWSRIRTPSMILTNPTMRLETAATLSSYIGSGLLIMFAASLLARMLGEKEPVEWDPKSVDFGKVRIGDTRFDVYVDGGPYIRALVQLIYAEKKNQAGRLRTRPRMEVVKQFIRNKRAPIFDFIGKIWTGRTYYGGPAWEIPDWQQEKVGAGPVKELAIKAGEKLTESDLGEGIYNVGKELFERTAPFFVQGGLEAAWNDGTAVGLVTGVDEFFSGQTLSYEPSTFAQAQILQDTVALNKHKELWDNLSQQQQNQLRSEYPEIEELEIKADGEMLRSEEISLAEQNRAAEKIQKGLPDELQKELKQISVRISAPSRRLGNFWLNNERYEAYKAYSAEEIEKSLKELFNEKDWIQTENKRKKLRARSSIDRGKARARNKLRENISTGEL